MVMEYNFHWAGKQQMEMLMQPLPPTWGKFGHTMATWASSLFRCKVRHPHTFLCMCIRIVTMGASEVSQVIMTCASYLAIHFT